MDGTYDPRQTIGQAIAGLIRATHDGLCSGEPNGIRYPGVPSVDDIARRMQVRDLGAAIDDHV